MYGAASMLTPGTWLLTKYWFIPITNSTLVMLAAKDGAEKKIAMIATRNAKTTDLRNMEIISSFHDFTFRAIAIKSLFSSTPSSKTWQSGSLNYAGKSLFCTKYYSAKPGSVYDISHCKNQHYDYLLAQG
jgi:hypothetical protein